jgi:DnaJ-class molecular chaperone
LVGFKRTVTHLNGEQFLVQSETITKPYSVKTIRDEGMPVHNFASESGKLKVTFNVVFPRTLTATQKNVAAEVLP